VDMKPNRFDTRFSLKINWVNYLRLWNFLFPTRTIMICYVQLLPGESPDTVEAVDALKRSPQGSKSLNTTLY
jgi:hypothetical protein